MSEVPFPEMGPQEHFGAVGTTRSGKTTLFKKKVEPEQTRWLTVDTKGEDWNHRPAVKWRDALTKIRYEDWSRRNHTSARFRWRIPMGVGEEATEEVNRFCYEAVRHLRNVTIYFDEVGAYCQAARIPDGMKLLITQGGGRDLRFYWGTQRPTMVHADIYDNSAWLAVFHVKTKDKKAVRKYFPYYEEHASEIPFKSFKFLMEDPSGEATVMGPV